MLFVTAYNEQSNILLFDLNMQIIHSLARYENVWHASYIVFIIIIRQILSHY